MPVTQDPTSPTGGYPSVLGVDPNAFISQLSQVAGTDVGPYLPPPPSQTPQVLWGYEQMQIPGGYVPTRDTTTSITGFSRRAQPGLGARKEGVTLRAQRPYSVKNPQWLSIDAAIADIYSWDAKKLSDFGARLVAAGKLSPGYSREQLFEAWNELVTRSAATTQSGHPLTPWDILSWWSAAPGDAGQPRTVVDRQVRISTPDEARNILRTMLSQLIGRAASETEVDDFQAQLNSAQRSNPVITTTTGVGTDTQSTTTRGGVVPEEIAREWAQGNVGDEWKMYTLVAQLYPELERIVEAPF